jgi:hypothetical protein
MLIVFAPHDRAIATVSSVDAESMIICSLMMDCPFSAESRSPIDPAAFNVGMMTLTKDNPVELPVSAGQEKIYHRWTDNPFSAVFLVNTH